MFTHALSHDLEAHKSTLKHDADAFLLAQKADFDRQLANFQSDLRRDADALLLAQKADFDRQLASFQSGLTDRLAHETRVRTELERWANPILDAVRSLNRRLGNILDGDGYVALVSNGKWNPEWSVTHAYFLISTIYLFAQYFCWERLLQESLRFDLFRSQADKDTFLDALRDIGRPLSSFPLDELKGLSPGDCQVFSLQQRAAGEALIVEKDTGPVCMRVADFFTKWADPAFASQFAPLAVLLDGLTPNTRRWQRLQLVRSALKPLDQQCMDKLTPLKGAAC